MTNKEIRELSDAQLVHAEVRAEREIALEGLRHRAGRLEDTSKLRRIRKEIARYQTVQREREIAAGLDKGSLKRSYAKSVDASDATAVAEPVATGESKGFLKGIVDKLAGRE